jgi:hypothetical protein
MGELTAAQASLILDAVRQVDSGATTPEAAHASLEVALAQLPSSPADAD